jgi:hypothetical protein
LTPLRAAAKAAAADQHIRFDRHCMVRQNKSIFQTAKHRTRIIAGLA